MNVALLFCQSAVRQQAEKKQATISRALEEHLVRILVAVTSVGRRVLLHVAFVLLPFLQGSISAREKSEIMVATAAQKSTQARMAQKLE